MVKSLRYDQNSRDNSSAAFAADRLRCTGNADANANFYGNPAPDRDTAPHGHADTRVDLSVAESRGEVGAARSV